MIVSISVLLKGLMSFKSGLLGMQDGYTPTPLLEYTSQPSDD